MSIDNRGPGIALLGCGFIGRVHALTLQGLIGAGILRGRLVVACDEVLERAERFKGTHGFLRATTNPLEAMDDPDVSVVYVATPTSSHVTLVEAAAARRHAIFCEKPLAHTAADAARMAKAIHQSGVPAQTGLVLRYHPVFTELHARLHDDDPDLDAGRPLAAVFRDDQCVPIEGRYGSTWRGDVAVSGGGTMIEHSIHDVDFLRWCFGKVRSVFATTSSIEKRAGIEDVCSALFTFEDGVTATLLSVWHRMPHRESDRHVELFSQKVWMRATESGDSSIEIHRTDGSIEHRDHDAILSSYRRRMSIPDSAPSEFTNPYVQQNLAFMRAIENGHRPWPGLDEAVQDHAVIDAIYESARTGLPAVPKST